MYDYAKKLNIQKKKKYKIMLMLMHRLNTTTDINIKEILPKGLPKVQDEELALHNKKNSCWNKGLGMELRDKGINYTLILWIYHNS